MAEDRLVEVSKEIDATPAAIFKALTHPLELTYWFSHDAWSEPWVGGHYLVHWRNGWWARGVYQVVERPRRIALTWQGKDEPGETDLVFDIRALEQGARVKITHSGYGADAIWDKAVAEAESSWPHALENLDSILTTGIDLRQARRPSLGVIAQELAPEQATWEGIGPERGLYLSSVLEGGSADKAGLQKDDVITSVGGVAVTDEDSLSMTLAPYKPGDEVQLTYVRGEDRSSVWLELRGQEVIDVSFDPREVVAQVGQEHETLMASLREVLEDLSEEQAEKQSAGQGWSIKEILAHLCLLERQRQQRFANIIVGSTSGQLGGDPTETPELLAMMRSTRSTLEELLDCFDRSTAETLALFAGLRPEVVAMKARYRDMAGSLYNRSVHIRDHINQIKRTAKMA